MKRIVGGQPNAANGSWKGDQVTYTALHEWVRNHLAKPDFCANCSVVPPLDVANISGEYKRDLSDWKWLCRKCHMVEDGRLERFRQQAINRKRPARLSEMHRKAISAGLIAWHKRRKESAQ